MIGSFGSSLLDVRIDAKSNSLLLVLALMMIDLT
jgi:hypothetical protein